LAVDRTECHGTESLEKVSSQDNISRVFRPLHYLVFLHMQSDNFDTTKDWINFNNKWQHLKPALEDGSESPPACFLVDGVRKTDVAICNV